ncbi:hypothetical protein PV379_45180, partial [Streptomyces caniscabiei]|uniref:hypothetical protein n=1 Tax=Streptomyces caniscabiei TaxID=2746961 RepID=UPI0029A2E950
QGRGVGGLGPWPRVARRLRLGGAGRSPALARCRPRPPVPPQRHDCPQLGRTTGWDGWMVDAAVVSGWR